MLLRHRIHEWFADRFAWVQYPDIRAAQRRVVRRGELSGPLRVGLGLLAWFGLIASGVLLLVAVYVIWALLSA